MTSEELRNPVECPLCRSSKVGFVESIAVERLILPWRGFEIDVLSELRGVSQLELWRCSYCSVLFFTPDFLAGSGQLYSRLEKFDWYYMSEKWEYNVALADLKGCHKVLEVGCGRGSFLRLGRQAGFQIDGLEQNKSAIEEASRLGLHMVDATIEEVAAQSSSTYDAVCSFQVLEHVANPGTFLDACCRLLRPGGRLLFGVPNADSFIRYEFNILDMPPHHMSRWPIRTLLDLGKFFPIELKHVLIEPLAEYHVGIYTDAYFSHFVRPLWRSLDHPRVRSWFGRVLRMGLRRVLRGQTVYARYERLPHGSGS
jgi:SAM-dependent methyltransferase